MSLNRVNPGGGGIRPLPDPGRTKEDIANMNIYALLVGIDKYQGKKITKLGGCVKDVNLVKTFLENKYKDRLKLRMLTDEEATYENIIAAFEQHLVNGGGEGKDTFWFHFSGHGSEQFTAEQFYKPVDANGKPMPTLAANGKDQTLVCYNPGGTTDGIYLADKELAILISRIHEKARSIGKIKPHILVTLDCCHSGTGTRAEGEIKSRKFDLLEQHTDRTTIPKPEEKRLLRTLDSYYKYHKNGPEKDKVGYYSDHIDNQSNLSIPMGQHLLISACTNLELAGDTTNGGVFTKSLLDAFGNWEKEGSNNEPPNYADLFTLTRSIAKSRRQTQTPQFEPVGNFNPYTAALEGWEKGGPGKYEILFKDERPYVRAGAINGLPTRRLEKKDKTQMLIYIDKGGYELVACGRVAKVGMQDSRLSGLNTIRRDEASGQMTITDEPYELVETVKYVAEIFTLPAEPIYVHIHGDEQAILKLTNRWADRSDEDPFDLKSINIIPVTELPAPEKPEIGIEARATKKGSQVIYEYGITNLLNNQHWFATNEADENPVAVTKEAIDRIVRWKRMWALKNEDSDLQNLYDLEFLTCDQFEYEDAGEPNWINDLGAFRDMLTRHSVKKGYVHPNGDQDTIRAGFIHLEGDEDTFMTNPKDYFPYIFQVRTAKDKEDLYFYFFEMMDNCAIVAQAPNELHLESTQEGQVSAFGKITEDGKVGTVGALEIGSKQKEANFRFKLFVTRQPVEIAALEQKGFKATREGSGSTSIAKPAAYVEDWHSINVHVKVTRNDE